MAANRIWRWILLFISAWSCLAFQSCGSSSNASAKQADESEWELIWSDEFNNGELPDIRKWNYDVGGGGWGNRELQYYTSKRPENCRIENGLLIIEARKEPYEGMKYTSARLTTKAKGDWIYGRFEIKARLPGGKGIWPAIWMLPSIGYYGNGGWPDNGEIDIMEHVGFEPNLVHASVHTKAYNGMYENHKTASVSVPAAEQDFHKYILQWSADKIEVFVDAKKYFTYVNDGKGWETWPFNKGFHLIINLAVGGNWGGRYGVDDAAFPQKLEIDYVRVYRRTD